MNDYLQVLQDPNKTIIGHNIKFDIKHIEKEFNIKHKCKLIDTSIMHALIDENSFDNSLQSLAAVYTNLGHYWDGIDKSKLKDAPFEKVITDNCYDAIVPLKVFEVLYPKLQEQNLTGIFDFLTEMISIFVDIEQNGIYINPHKLAGLSQKYAMPVNYLTNKYPNLSLKSDAQVANVLYNILGFPVKQVTRKTKQPAVHKDALAELKSIPDLNIKQQAFLDDLLEFRKATKMVEHIKNITDNMFNGRVYTNYNLAKGYTDDGELRGAVTGRLSSNDAQLHNKPTDSEFRSMFEVTPNWENFGSPDYSQIEYRVAAFLSREPNFIKAFIEGKDLHTATLAKLQNEDYFRIADIIDNWNKDSWEYKYWNGYRLVIKRVNFGILYGMHKNKFIKIARQMNLELTDQQVEGILQEWYADHRILLDWIRATEDEVIQNGYLTTIFKRRRHLEGANRKSDSGHRMLRQGVNFLIQSPASDICQLGIYHLYHKFKEWNEKVGDTVARLLMTVHDEIIFESKITDIPNLKATVQDCMITKVKQSMYDRFGIQFDIPLEVDIQIGTHWS